MIRVIYWTELTSNLRLPRACQRDTNLELSTYSLHMARNDEQGHECDEKTCQIWLTIVELRLLILSREMLCQVP
jgi:hypothetical protein